MPATAERLDELDTRICGLWIQLEGLALDMFMTQHFNLPLADAYLEEITSWMRRL